MSTPQEVTVSPAPWLVYEYTLVSVPDLYFPIGWAASRSTVLRHAFSRFAHVGGSSVPIHVPVSWDCKTQIAL
jgi:hypothetical protein